MTLATPTMDGAVSKPVSKSRIIAACTIGNALEFFDFVIFSFFARTIGQLFFPSQDPTAQLLLAFFTRTGVGTLIAEGKPVQVFDGETYIQERWLRADVALVHAWKADTEGNLVFRKTARNFNPMMATAARVTVVQCEHLVEVGSIDPDHIHTPGVFVQRIVHVPNAPKRIENRTIRQKAA